MQMIGVARLGRDAELRHVPNGDAVASLSLAFNYGRKGEDGNKPTQWVEGALWGKLAEALIDYLVKGQQVCVTLDDPHTEEFQKRDGGMGYKLVGRISQIELVGKRDQQAAPAPQQQRQPTGQTAHGAAKSNGYAPQKPAFDNMDDDIPFN